MAEERIVAVALLTRGDVQRLGDNFNRLWPVDETPCFAGLVEAIDAADRVVRTEQANDPNWSVSLRPPAAHRQR